MMKLFIRGPVRLGLSILLYAVVCNGYAVDLSPEIVRIPFQATDAPMVAGVFRPAGDGPFPVVIYSHGRSATESERSLTSVPDPRGHVRYWLRKGFAVVAAIRPGYGKTGGIDDEDSGGGPVQMPGPVLVHVDLCAAGAAADERDERPHP